MNKTLILETMLNSPGHIQQKLINSLVENGVGTYSPKKCPNLIQFTNKIIKEKISESIKLQNITFKIIDLIEISKGYRYSVIYKCESIDMNQLKENCLDINSNYYDDFDEMSTMFLEDNEHIYIKFHRKINLLKKENGLYWNEIRYPLLFVFHKNLKLLEARFDRLQIEEDKTLYRTYLKTSLDYLEKTLNVKWSHVNMDEIIRKAVELYNGNVIVELIWSGELTKSRGITLKAGKDMVMPFWGELPIEINRLREKYSDKPDALDCLGDIENYLNEERKYANERIRGFRLIKALKNEQYIKLERPIELTVTFNHGESMIDLINIYDSEFNDMERMDYVIKLIAETKKYIK
ncbi:MAG: hypothetical protein ACLR02_06005 [Clostridium sp.]|nr:hypothetical protein [Clostridium sp.]